ncbi:tRNA (guanosine(18)-2'-O)-methyltransferase [Sarracenia purpurea var. burkii]
MVPFFLRLVGLSMGMLQSEELAIYGWSRCPIFLGVDDYLTNSETDIDSMMSHSGSFPLHISCQFLTSMLDFAGQSQYAGGNASKSNLFNGYHAEKFAKNLLWDLCNMTVRMLGQSIEHRSCAIKFFLPTIFKAFVFHHVYEISVRGQTYTLSRNYFFKKIWASCRTLFSMGPSERRDSFCALSLYMTYFSCTGECEDDDARGKEGFDIRADKEFWEEIKKGLVDEEGSVRKQSLHILKTILQLNERSQCSSGVSGSTSSRNNSMPDGLTKKGRWADKEAKSLGVGKICDSVGPSLNCQQKWVAFFLLYEMLEEYGTHLVEAAWNHQITLLLHSSFPRDDFMKSVSGVLDQNLMEASADIFNWLSVLWERGFLHDNPQVRCLIMESFLGIEWKNYGHCAKLVPEDFVLGPFIQGLNDPVHHKDFGLKGIYSSRTIEGAAKFMLQYARDLNLSGKQSSRGLGKEKKRLAFLTNLASASKKQSFGRAGLMGLAECIASAACGVHIHCKDDVEWSKDDSFDMIQGQSVTSISFHNDKTDLLDIMRFIIESSKQHFNPNYRIRVCEKVLDAAASVMHAFDVSLETLLHFISAVPREFTDCGGSLRLKVQVWLSACDNKHCTSNSCCTVEQHLKSLCDFPRSFICCHHSVSISVNYDDEDLDAWAFEAKRWARVLFLVIKEDHYVDPMLTVNLHCLPTNYTFFTKYSRHHYLVCK